MGKKARGWTESEGEQDYLRMCGQGQHPGALPREQILEITNKTRPRAGPSVFQTKGTVGTKAQRLRSRCVLEQTGNLCDKGTH